MTINELYAAAEAADNAFQVAVVRQFGKKNAGDMRYRSKMHNAETKAAADAYHLAAHNLFEAKDAAKKAQSLAAKCDAWSEYNAAANELARKGLTGKLGDPLPNLMSAAAVELINDDPEAFERRVRQCAYALAMAHIPEVTA